MGSYTIEVTHEKANEISGHWWRRIEVCDCFVFLAFHRLYFLIKVRVIVVYLF